MPTTRKGVGPTREPPDKYPNLSDITTVNLPPESDGDDVNMDTVDLVNESVDNNCIQKTETPVETPVKTPLHETDKVFDINIRISDNAPGPYLVFIEHKNKDIGRIHPMAIGHILHNKLNIRKDILLVKSVNRRKISVELKSAVSANKLIEHPLLAQEQLVAYVPKHTVQRIGVIRGVDTSFKDDYLLETIESPFAVLEVQRFKRRVSQPGEELKLVPRQMIKVIFKGQVLPKYIKINSVCCEVESYVQRVIQCNKCLNYGHLAKNCKSNSTKCKNCSDVHDGPCRKGTFCVHCSSSLHASNSRDCPMFSKQKRIKEIMAEHNITYKEAEQIEKNPSFSKTILSNRYQCLYDINDKDMFPVISNKKSTSNQVNSMLTNNNAAVSSHTAVQERQFLSQPLRKITESQYKKRKPVSPISPPPKSVLTFDLRQLPLQPLASNPYRPPDPDTILFNQKDTIISGLSELIVNTIKSIKCVDDLVNINENSIKCNLEKFFINFNNGD